VRGARHSRGRAGSNGQPDATEVADARLRSSSVVNVAFDKPSKKPTRPHARRMGRPGRRRDLFWVLVLYLIIIIGAMIASGAYLLS
jgi:hypothetical protein